MVRLDGIRWLAACAALMTWAPAMAGPPLIYEGRLTTGGQPPDPWPGLRFAVVDAEGEVWWSTLVEPGGPHVEVGPDGRFVAYIEDSPENPWAVAGFDQGRWLRVEVCPGAWPANPADDCGWVRLEQTQRLGAVPVALGLSASGTRTPTYQEEDLIVSTRPRPGEFASIHAALAALDRTVLPPDRDIRIRVQPGIYQHDSPVEIWRSDSTRLHIVGQGEEPGDVQLFFDRSDGLRVHPGARLGLVDGMTFVGDRFRLPDGPDQSGIVVALGATLSLGERLVVREFTDNCIMTSGGVIHAAGVRAELCGGDGILAFWNGFIAARDASAISNGDTGIEAYIGGGVATTGATTRGNNRGLEASHAGHVFFRESTVEDNAVNYRVEGNAYIYGWRSNERPPAVGADASYIYR